MRKAIPAIILLATVASGVFVVLQRSEPHRSRAAELAPAEALFFAQWPDLARSAKRFEQTALRALLAEPDMRAFLERPLGSMPMLEKWPQLVRIAPREVFVAVTSPDGARAKFVAGMAFSGSRTEVEKLMAAPRAYMKSTWPVGKADLLHYGASEIELFTWPTGAMADTFRGRWYLVANDLDLLKATIDRADGRGGAALAGSETFRQVTAPLPADADMLLVVRPGASIAAGNREAKSEGLAYAAKIDGAQMRDVIFIPSAGGQGTPLPRRTLALSTPDTFLYYAMAVPEQLQLGGGAALVLELLGPTFEPMAKALAEEGLKWADFGTAFGPELGSLGDWRVEEDAPTGLLALEVRDVAKARALLEVLTGPSLGGEAWGRHEADGVMLYQAPGAALAMPSLALSERFLVLGLGREAAQTGLARLDGEATIGQDAGYLAAGREVREPTGGYGYLDLKTLFERSYGMFRPFIGMSLSVSGDAGQWVDAEKLPATEVIARHLSPIIITQSTTGQGTLVESRGPVTFAQAIAAGVAAVGSSAFPSVDSAMQFDPSQLLQRFGTGPARPGSVPAKPAKPPESSQP